MLETLMKFTRLADRIVPRRPAERILEHVCLKDGSIMATDLETTIRMPIEDERRYTMPFAAMKRVLKSRPEKIKAEIGPERIVLIKYDNKCVTVKSLSPDDFPSAPSGKFNNIGEWDEQVLRVLGGMIPFTSKEQLKPALKGIYVDLRKNLLFAATDGHVLREARMPQIRLKLNGGFCGIIPSGPIPELIKHARGKVKLSVSDTHIRFILNEETELFVKLIEEKFPDYEEFIGEKKASLVILERDALLKLLTEAISFSSRDTYQGIFSSKNGCLSLSTRAPERDLTFTAEIAPIEKSEEDVRIGFNMKYLEKVIKGISSEQVKWEYDSHISASIFKGNEEPGSVITTLLMPIRI